MIAIDMTVPRFCAECRFMLSGTWVDGKEYPCVCYAQKPPMLIKPSETDMRDGMCPLIDLSKYEDDCK
jgi:hypothetical protein